MILTHPDLVLALYALLLWHQCRDVPRTWALRWTLCKALVGRLSSKDRAALGALAWPPDHSYQPLYDKIRQYPGGFDIGVCLSRAGWAEVVE